MLNKKCLFGWLCVANIILALSVFTQIGVTHEGDISTKDPWNLLNRFSWRVIANQKIFDAEQGSWITEKKYSKSIREVIGEAIADCLSEKR